jgi:pimeloyl-ACP methyl ester carboxylesterase
MDSSIWESQTAYFARHYPTYCINLPGHGGSDGNGEEKIDLYAQSVQAVLDELMPRDPYLLVGHSMGGAIAMEVAIRAAPYVLGIVLMGTAARPRVMPIVFQTITKHRERFFKSIAYVAFGPDTRNELRERLIAATRRCPLPVTVKDLRACNAFDIGDRLRAITIPTLIICGAEDQLTPVNLAHDLKRRIAGSRLVVIPAAGHMVMLEAPDAVNREIEDFLAGILDCEG